MNDDLDYTFHAMGSDVRLLIGRPFVPARPDTARCRRP